MCGHWIPSSMHLVVSQWFNKEFLTCLEPKKNAHTHYFSFYWEVLFILGYIFNTQSGSLKLCLSLYYLLAQSLEVNQRWELMAFSVLSWACAQPWTYVWPFRFPRICRSFQSSYSLKHLTFQLLLPSFSVFYCLPQVLSLPMWEHLKHLPLNIFGYTPRVAISTLGDFQVR